MRVFVLRLIQTARVDVRQRWKNRAVLDFLTRPSALTRVDVISTADNVIFAERQRARKAARVDARSLNEPLNVYSMVYQSHSGDIVIRNVAHTLLGLGFIPYF
jgi:hypothetical protein